MGIGIVSTNKGDFTFQSPEDAIKFIRTAAQENNDIWLSYNDKNQKEVTFMKDQAVFSGRIYKSGFIKLGGNYES